MPANDSMSYMFCEECGNKISSTAKFCSSCGTSVAGGASAAPTPAPAPAPVASETNTFRRYESKSEPEPTRQVFAEEAPQEDDDDEDYLVFAFSPSDGSFYPATIEARYADTTVDLEYMDGMRRNVGRNEFMVLADAFASPDLQSNWENGGTYYGCKIHRICEDGDVEVIYKMDGVFEKVRISQLRVKGKKKRKGLFG